MKRYILPLVLLGALVFLLAGCKSSKTSPQPSSESVEKVFETLADSYMPWTDVEIPVKFEIRSPKKFSIGATAKMTADGCILFSFRVFGIEMGSLWIDSDSVQAIVKPMVYKEGIASLTARTGLTVSELQAILMGRVFQVGHGAVESPMASGFITRVASGNWSIMPRRTSPDARWDFEGKFNAEGRPELDVLDIYPEGFPSVKVSYAPPAVTPAGPFAPEMNISVEVDGKEVDFVCRWNTERAKWNKGIKLSAPRIPKDAERLSSAQVLKMLEKL